MGGGLGGLLGCEAEGQLPRSLRELERMAFVPAATTGFPPGVLGRIAVTALPHALLVDRFEATRADLAWYGLAEPDPDVWSLERSWLERASADWPASLSHVEAVEFAEVRGMRLLSAQEWIHVAVGPRRHRFPWGSTDQRSTANTLELGLGRPLPVGTFESGRSEPFGCYDLLGNVWEWVADRVPGYADPPGDDLTPPWRVSAMGGSFLSQKHETYGPSSLSGVRRPAFHAITLDPRHRAPDIGVRCATDARGYLQRFAGDWGGVPTERLEAIGAGWGSDAVGLLEDLVAGAGSHDALRALLAGARKAR